MVKKLIGIISYLPDDEEIRKVRLEKLTKLLGVCNSAFNLPIMIIAQNWKGIKLSEENLNNPIYVYRAESKLGIRNARQVLKDLFVESEYDFLIMLDDDVEITGSQEGIEKYLEAVDKNPNGWTYMIPHSLWLFGISKEMAKVFNYPLGGADDKDKNLRYFEDIYMQESLSKVYPDTYFKSDTSKLWPKADAAWDKYNSGWHNEIYDTENKWIRQDTGDSTRFLITQATKDTITHPEKYIRRLDAEMMPTKYKSLTEKFIKDWPEHLQEYLTRQEQLKHKTNKKKKKKK